MKNTKAFSLVELLISLIIISIILTSLAPVITKRTKSNKQTVEVVHVHKFVSGSKESEKTEDVGGEINEAIEKAEANAQEIINIKNDNTTKIDDVENITEEDLKKALDTIDGLDEKTKKELFKQIMKFK